MTWRVYMHRTPDGRVYIGATSQEVEKRWKAGYHGGRFKEAIDLYGWEQMDHIVVRKGLTLEEASAWEQEMIRLYDATNPKYGYNSSPGGFAGHLQSEETKAKIRESKIGVPRPEWIHERMRSAPRRYTYTDDHRRRISEALKGHPTSEATRNLIREKNRNKNGRKVAQFTREGERVAEYPSVMEAWRQTGIFPQSIGENCLGKRKSAGGYVWRYVE